MRMTLSDKLHLSPLVEPKYCLDVATGTGIWAIEFAQEHPNAKVIGTDLSAIQPANRPENVDFIKDDAEEEWLFPQVPAFDFIHLRLVSSSFDDPRKVMESAINGLGEGGWLEYHDLTWAPEWMPDCEGGELSVKTDEGK